jgi:hypothetical protein
MFRHRSRLVMPLFVLLGVAVALVTPATARGGTGFTFGSEDPRTGSCLGKEDPAGLVFTNLHVSRNGGNTYGVNAAVDIAAKDWHGGSGSSESFYVLTTGCKNQTDWVTQSNFLTSTFGYHERFWQEVNQKVISASHHDQPCTNTNDSANNYNSSRDLMAQFFNDFQDTHGNFPFTYTTTADRTPTDWFKCGTRYHVSDDGKTRRVNQIIGTAYIN